MNLKQERLLNARNQKSKALENEVTETLTAQVSLNLLENNAVYKQHRLNLTKRLKHSGAHMQNVKNLSNSGSKLLV